MYYKEWTVGKRDKGDCGVITARKVDTPRMCWKIHGKSTNWKPRKKKEAKGLIVSNEDVAP